MEPERRFSVRANLRLEVILRGNRSGVTYGKARNMNLNGVFVELEPLTSPPDEVLEAALLLPFRRELRQIQLPAVVLRAAEDGVALKFSPYDLATYKTLVNLLYSQ